MFRLIGFLLGVVIMIVMLAAVIDAPTRERAGILATNLSTAILDALERLATKQDVEGARPDDESSRAQGTPDDISDSSAIENAHSTVASESEITGSPSDEPADADEVVADSGEAMPNSVPSPYVQNDPAYLTSTSSAGATDSMTEESNWEPVWWAFRSEISANGFADYLKHLTGREYRVRRTSPWSYQVELSYVDEGQRDAVLREIQSKTGLGLSEPPS